MTTGYRRATWCLGSWNGPSWRRGFRQEYGERQRWINQWNYTETNYYFFNLYWNLLLFETNILLFSIIKIQLYFACEETYFFKYEREEHHYEHPFLHLFLGSVLKRFMWALFYPPIKISYLLRKSYFNHFAGDRTQVAIAIFPITAATISLAPVSQVARTPVVANTNLLLRAVALLPPRLYSLAV